MKKLIWILFVGVALSQLTVISCKKEAKKKSGGAAPPQETTPPGDTGGGDDGEQTSASGPAKTLKQCNDDGDAWIAVVNGGKSPSSCGSKLADFGCCKESVMARFKTLASDLGSRIDSNVDSKFQLYNCSQAGDKSYKMHFAKFPGGGKVEYREIAIDAFAYEPDSKADSCPKLPDVDFPDINDLVGDDDKDGNDDKDDTDDKDDADDNDDGDSSQLSLAFEQEINPIMKTDCAGSGCHGTSGAGSIELVDNEDEFKKHRDEIIERIERSPGSDGAMPPSQALGTTDKQAILDYIDSL